MSPKAQIGLFEQTLRAQHNYYQELGYLKLRKAMFCIFNAHDDE